ncbi:MAG: phage tail protein [Saprospiraceae bacterium]
MAKKADKKWPVAKYHFRVTIDGKIYSFQEISGLQVETPIIEYRVGGKDLHTIKLAGITKTSNLILKKGIFETDDDLIKIFDKLYKRDYFDENKKFDILVELLSADVKPVMKWNIKRAYPIKLIGTDFKSSENAVAIESMEFAYEELITSI